MMTQALLWTLSILLLLLGATGFAVKRDYVRRIIAFNVMSTAVLLMFAGFAVTVEDEPMLTGVFVVLLLVTSVLTALTLSMRSQLVSRFNLSDRDR